MLIVNLVVTLDSTEKVQLQNDIFDELNAIDPNGMHLGRSIRSNMLESTQ